MAFDTYMQFMDSTFNWIAGESQAQIAGDSPLGTDIQMKNIFEIDDFSFDVEQVLNIGSQSSGAGSGKITFNPFQITRKSDRLSPLLFAMCCTGEHFQVASLYLRRAGGQGGQAGVANTVGLGAGSATAASGVTFLRFDFALAAVATISWSGSDGDEAMKEEVTFGYGALQVSYVQQDVTGKPLTTDQKYKPRAAWNRVFNNNSFPDMTAKKGLGTPV